MMSDSSTMQAMQITGYGGSEVVVITTVPKPAVANGKILVEVAAAGVNPFDWKVRQGYMKDAIPLDLPVTLGGDFAGTVIAIGDGVTGFAKGDEVYGTANILSGGTGSFAQFALADAGNAAKKPENVSLIEAGALPLTSVSAWTALVEHLHLQEDQKILIHGGAGGIGTMAIQLAKHLGAYVATTAKTADLEYVQELGADEVIDYKTQKFEDVVSGYDAVFDTVGAETYTRSFAVLKKDGMIVSMVEKPDQELMNRYGVQAISQSTKVTNERLRHVAKLVEEGAMQVHIEKSFPLTEAAEALAYLQNEHPNGKVILEM